MIREAERESIPLIANDDLLEKTEIELLGKMDSVARKEEKKPTFTTNEKDNLATRLLRERNRGEIPYQ